MTQETVEPFSEGYYLLNADVRPYSGDTVAVPKDLLESVMQSVEVPLFKIANGHYVPETQRGIPAETVAVPDYISAETEQVLVAKDDTAAHAVLRGG